MTTAILKQALENAVAAARAPGAVACVGIGGQRVLLEAAGNRALTPRRETATTDTIYDLASLTKVVATTTAVMLLRDEGKIALDQSVADFIPLPDLDRLTIRHLLTHTTGLPAWRAWYQEATGGILEFVERISEMASGAVPGHRRIYSDFGFILLMKIVEQVSEDTFDNVCRRRIFEPLAMTDTMFNPPEAVRGRCAPTERCTWRNRVVHGEVHDENASSLGGVSGHAGLFSTAPDLERYCQALLRGDILSLRTLHEMTTVGQTPYYPWQGLGWWVDPWSIGTNGFLLSRTAFGHTGWTGTSLWMDRATGLYAILLGNTCHPDRNRRDNGRMRRHFYTRVADVYYPRTTNAHTGLDKLLRNEFAELRGKRLALLTNHAAVDQLGRPIRDVFALDKSLDLRYLYSPEHGLFGQAEAGEHVASVAGRVPIISLYGERKQPAAEELRQVDLFIVDLPDVGSRYYTYMYTMKNCMAACAAHGTPVMVLDRPNPVGGHILEGPIAQRFGASVCAAPVPVRHGMTLGELALYFEQTELSGSRLDLTVLTAENWWREIQFDDCAMPWAPPSPNIPTAEAALMYVGTCLFEGLNMNEGRGTESPFLLCGAPWLDAPQIIESLSPEERTGCTLQPTLYIPRSIPGKAANPKYKDLLCRGIRFSITDRYTVRPFKTTLALIRAIQQQHRELEWTSFFDTLAGGTELREQLQAGRSAQEITDSISADLVAFDARKPRLYPTLTERRRNTTR